MPSPASLSAPEQALLSALAIAPGGLTRSGLLKLLLAQSVRVDGKRIDAARLATMVASLRRAGWIGSDGSGSGHGQPVRLATARRNAWLRHLSAMPDLAAWTQRMRAALPPRAEWMTPDRARVEQALWLHLLEGDGDGDEAMQEVRRLLHVVPVEELATLHPAALLLADAEGRALFDALAPALQRRLLADYLMLSNHFFWPAAGAYRRALALDAAAHRGFSEQLLLQAFWRGDMVALAQLGTAPGLDGLAAFLSLLARGQPVPALDTLEDWFKAERKRTGKRKLELSRALDTLRMLAVLVSGDPVRYPALRRELAQSMQQLRGASHVLMLQLLERLMGEAPSLAPEAWPRMLSRAGVQGLDCLASALAIHWLDAAPPEWPDWLQDWRRRYDDGGYQWLAAEFDALLSARSDGPTDGAYWHGQHGLAPLVALYRRQEAWEYALQALAQVGGPAGAVPAAGSGRRLAWFLSQHSYGSAIEPREQKRGAKGQWSKGRTVALRRLVEETDSFDCLVEQDRKAIAAIRVDRSSYYGTQYELPLEQALPQLVGHPALYWADAPDVRIDLQAGEPSLHLREEAGRIHLRLEPEGIGEAGDLWLHKETPTRLRLYPVGRELKQIAGIVGQGLAVPAEARAQLVHAIAAIAPLLPVHSDLPELAGDLETIDGDGTLYAHLLPLSEGLRMQLLVRPQADGGWFRPGHGAAHLVGERDGAPVQVRRDLDGERATLQHVLEHCPALALADGDGQEWQLERVQDALQLLSELQALDPARVQCVWPEGERMRIRGRPGMGQLRLSMRQQGDWFALQGDVALDDGRVLQLRQLLELTRAGNGRFVRLGDGDWLALGDDLRRRLEDLSHLADKVDGRGVQLSALTAPLVAALAEEAGAFEADAAWQDQLQRLESLHRFEPTLPRALQAQLRDYQREGFDWLARLAEWGVGACLADDMGLGKTVQLLALLLHRAALGPQLVVAPTSVVPNWQAEAQRFAPSLRLHDYRSLRSLDDLGPGHLVLVSYSLLQQDQDAFAAQAWTSVVLDEAQAIKNAQTKRSQAVMALQAGFRVVASGTPLENHLGELWNLFRFINPGLLGSQERFASRFAHPIENGDKAARRALRQLIQPFMLRRLKSQVLDELPERTDITQKVVLSDAERHQYEALRQQAVAELAQGDGDEGAQSLQVLAQITRLRRFCCHPKLVLPGSTLASSKLQVLAGIVGELRDNGHRALVFSQFVDHLRIVRDWLEREGIAYQYLDGATPARQRTAAVNAFQAGAGDVFLISLKAGGSGLNLTAADYVIHLDPWWNPAVEDQASDRAHRIGQQRPVTVYRLVAEHTIEERIVELHAHKRDLADSLLEGGDVSARLDADALLALIRNG
ncbi:DEAD/DEAH box helicase [Luteimonas sp. XNQY3]|nr:DEAD/DEAH box helicase [Luteimonas sp. XNQY3]MCD9007135.1 DEAD/DEAH box helicase [Luteimonas sp. XNQY3]